MLIRRASARVADAFMCASINLLQWRHRLNGESAGEVERYVAACENLTLQDYYSTHDSGELAHLGSDASTLTWRSPVETKFPANDVARVDCFPCAAGWSAPTLLMLHALMSATDIGYRRLARRFNARGWNACFVHLPYHYSRVPSGYWNGELAITADLVRNAEGLRQGVKEIRQLLHALRNRGCDQFGILGTSYGAWIGALLACVEPDLRFVALMAPIVNVEHAVWQSPAAYFMRRELHRAGIEPQTIARHFHLSSVSHNQPACGAEKVLLVSGEFDMIARPNDIAELHRKWNGSELLTVPQGHFGYRMLRETIARVEHRL
jgi:pimeloyl-ACP methyl ester carboxylesterase